MRRTAWWRWGGRALGAFGGGVVLTVAIAWANVGRHAGGGSGWRPEPLTAAAAMQLWQTERPADFAEQTTGGHTARSVACTVTVAFGRSAGGPEAICELRYGWPMRAMRMVNYRTNPPLPATRQFRGAFLTGGSILPPAVPWLVVWPGLLVDAVFLAAASVLVVMLVSAGRRWWRRRRGRCGGCGYDTRLIDATRCPECGATLRPRS
ncbi:MAG: hypothetical protein HKO59_04195 [Phycisphaerales bacterium]|nr:hypothetical protein [Phycisphaerae bacterium]NNF43916.1 hypothetical protein [Phycisphaerales bacterium]NNM25179.1 hypothetical protein [Phycisphaerales bacterium]